MDKTDFRRERKALYSARAGWFTPVEVPPLPFLMIDGRGSPDGEGFAAATAAIYAVAYGLKFMSKVECVRDFVVPPLEGLWWADSLSHFHEGQKALWFWRLMLPQPDWITPDMFARAVVGAVRKAQKEGQGNGALGRLRLDHYNEGLSVQTLHLGPYDAEGPLIAALHEWIADNGLIETGPHHEVCLSDPRRAAPEKRRTILRQPVRRVQSD